MLNIFIVDDSTVVRNALINLLQTIGDVKIIGSVGTVHEALVLIPDLHPQEVVLDIHIGADSGLDVLTEITKGEFPPIILMLTAYSHPGLRSRCLGAGAQYFFDKASEIDSFVTTVRKLALSFVS